MLATLPDDLVRRCAEQLGARDLGRLAACCTSLRHVAQDALCRRGVEVWDRQLAAVAESAAYARLERLTVRGVPRRYHSGPVPSPPLNPEWFAFAHLKKLTLWHCRFPGGGPFWKRVLEACPALEDVTVITDFFLGNYAADVDHYVDLVTLGAGRLKRLDIEGSWLLFTPASATSQGDIHRAVARAHAAPCVPSDTLEFYRSSCQQAPMAVDSPRLMRAVVVEPNEGPLLVSRMGPATKSACRHLEWTASWRVFDARALAPFRNLETLDVRVEASTVTRINRCINSLYHLPPTLRRLSLRLDNWLMTYEESAICWGRPLAHLEALTTLEIRMRAPPSTVADVLAGWLGAGTGVRTIVVEFEETSDHEFEMEIARLLEEEADPDADEIREIRDLWEEAARPVDPSRLLAWLDAHPACEVTVRNMPTLERAAPVHPRLHLAGGS